MLILVILFAMAAAVAGMASKFHWDLRINQTSHALCAQLTGLPCIFSGSRQCSYAQVVSYDTKIKIVSSMISTRSAKFSSRENIEACESSWGSVEVFA